MLINRQIIYLKHSPDNSDIEGTPYKAIRPIGMADADFNSILNFFKKIVDETKVDGLRYSDDTLMKFNLNHFCLSGGTVLFKVVESVKMPGSGVPELYGFFTPVSDVRTMWLEIGKMCYLLASEIPGGVKDGAIDYEELSAYDSNSVHGVKSYYRTSLETMVKDLFSSPFPINAALTSMPDEFYPQGVKFYSNGTNSEKTDSTLKEVGIEFDNKKIRYTIGKCNQSLKSALLVSVPHDDEIKGGFLKLKKKGEGSAKAIRQWCYDYTHNGQQQSDNCDFIVLDKAFEYSPVGDTFNAYIGNIGTNAERLPRVEGARLVSKVATLEPEVVETPKDPEISKAKEMPAKISKPVKAKKEPAPDISKTPSAVAEPETQHKTQTEVKPVKSVKPVKQPKPEKQSKPEKQPKPAKPSKPPKPGVKVHPLLQQAQERREEESAAARSQKSAPVPVPPRQGNSDDRPSRSKFGQKVHPLLQQAQDNASGFETKPRGDAPPPPPRPEPRPGGEPGRPMRSKFGPKPQYAPRPEEETPKSTENSVMQPETNGNDDAMISESRPAPLPRYAPPQKKEP
ncbi:MAG: hypothetical protein FWG33_01845 [Oscillospiraceae bacterium]|nr:hypothetical protein [Oscillospiraceae bacterium]